jgi:hypothetical protein
LRKTDNGKGRNTSQNGKRDDADGYVKWIRHSALDNESPKSSAYRAAGSSHTAGDDDAPTETLPATQLSGGSEVMWLGCHTRWSDQLVLLRMGRIAHLPQACPDCVPRHMKKERESQKNQGEDYQWIEPMSQGKQDPTNRHQRQKCA